MNNKGKRAKVYHADLYGLRGHKYAWLQQHEWKTTEWHEVDPAPELRLFVPRDQAVFEDYSRFRKITDIFSVNSTGIVTHRDRFVFDFDRRSLERRVRAFLDPTIPDAIVQETFRLKDDRDWKLAEKRPLIQEDREWQKKFVECLYRPLDVRWLFYHRHAINFGRQNVMRNMVHGNMALVTTRMTKGETFQHALVTERPIEKILMSPKTSNNAFIFPLYVYEAGVSADSLFTSSLPPVERKPNLNPEIVAALAGAYGRDPSPEEIFHYVYAVLYAPTYREKYAEFLRLDFPRIPFTSDPELFKKMAELGERLVELHLLRSPELDPPLARFQGEGDGKVIVSGKKGLRYDAEAQRVYINPSQYFAPVPPEV